MRILITRPDPNEIGSRIYIFPYSDEWTRQEKIGFLSKLRVLSKLLMGLNDRDELPASWRIVLTAR